MAGAEEPQHVLVWRLLECQPDLSVPIHSHLWSKYSKIPGLNLFLQESYCTSLICGFPNFYIFPFQSWSTVARRERGHHCSQALVQHWHIGVILCDLPSQCSSDRLFQEIPKTPLTWEHCDIWACALWHFSLLEWIGKTGIFGRTVIFEIFEEMSGEKGGEGREGEKRQRSRHSRWE